MSVGRGAATGAARGCKVGGEGTLQTSALTVSRRKRQISSCRAPGGRASPEVLRVPVGTVVHEVPAATDPLDAAWAEFEAERGDGARYQSSAELGMGEAEEGFETGQEWDEVVQHFGWDTGEVREELLAPGTEVEDEDLPVLADLSAPCDRVVVARGGAGGKGSLLLKRPGVSLSEIDTEERLGETWTSTWAARVGECLGRTPLSVRVMPAPHAGRPGEERKLRLLLKLLGDVGLVGLPNGGQAWEARLRCSHGRGLGLLTLATFSAFSGEVVSIARAVARGPRRRGLPIHDADPQRGRPGGERHARCQVVP